MAINPKPQPQKPRWRDWLDWAAFAISLAAFLISVWTAVYSKGQYDVAKQQLDVALKAFQTGQENVAITLSRVDDGPVERSPTTFSMPHEGRMSTLVVAHWTAIVSNTSTAAATSIVRFEVWGRQADGTVFSDTIDGVTEPDKKASVRYPLILPPGGAASLDVRASIPVSTAAAHILEHLQMPLKTPQVEDALLPIGQDLFGNQMAKTGQSLLVGGSGIGNDPTVELVAVTARGQRFVGQGHWYLR